MTAMQPTHLLTQELSCAICLQLYEDPVSLPCGHSFCLACVNSTQKSRSPGVLPCCPECRQQYEGPEALLKNFKLCGIVEGFRMAVSDGVLKEREVAVACEHCLESTVPAVKTCLHCNTSLCPGHLNKHLERQSSGTYTTVDPVREQCVRSCAKHGRDVEYLCSSDRVFLCSECVTEGAHLQHEVQTLEAAKGDMRRVVEGLGKSASDRLQLTEGLLRSCRDRAKSAGNPSEVLEARATILLDTMSARVSAYKKRMSMLAEEELMEQEKVWKSSMDVLNQYQQQLSQAQGAAQNLLSSSSSDVLFISYFLTLEQQLRQAASVTVPTLPVVQRADTKRLRASLATGDFHAEMSDLLRSLLSLTSPLELTFDPASLHPSLMVSTDLQTVRHRGGKASLREQSDRFTTAAQVLCQQSFSGGTHVWAVELGSGCTWSAGLCYGTIPRKGEHSKLGHNALSWRLQWKSKKLTASHDSVITTLGEVPAVPPKRLEVALDYNGGTLAFYSIGAGKKQHLHTFRAVFKEAVYPAFGIHSTSDESWITLLNGV
ncbi:E3 ubiquitin/ISG15 ligase TRIM25 [Brachyhypopomus gauderio]|uniref:E3 ubiquitin/ISG15 ligase TRIM25 n=1 Tax=Brachyhypopomus gauderio TaxID=698409 RepID=UPI004042DDB1